MKIWRHPNQHDQKVFLLKNTFKKYRCLYKIYPWKPQSVIRKGKFHDSMLDADAIC